MARPLRLLALGAPFLALCTLLGLGGSSALLAPTGANRLEVAKHQLADFVAWFVLQIIEVVVSLLPGLLLTGFISTLYTHRERLTTTLYTHRERLTMKVKGGLLAVFACALILAVQRQLVHAPEPVAPAGQQGHIPGPAGPKNASLPAVAPVVPVSGEEVLMSDGNFVRLADPTKIDGSPLEPDWRQALAKSLVTAIAQGEEQVVIMFTRQGCPWCVRQIPVLQDAIRRRTPGAQAAMVGAARGLGFVGGTGRAGSMLNAPLRVFILDAMEFPELIQQFGIEAFPTSLVFGAPRVTPLIGKGFLDAETFEEYCRVAAESEPEPEVTPGQRKAGSGRGRRRGLLFR